MHSIPVIDISSLENIDSPDILTIGNALCDAAQESGFFYVKGHGVAEQLIDSVFNVSQEFFMLPDSQKSGVKVSGAHRGYLRVGESTMEGYSQADQKESFIWGRDIDAASNGGAKTGNLPAANRWPQELPQLRTVLVDYFDSVHQCAFKILRAMAAALELTPNFFTRNFQHPTSRGSLIHYPAGANANEQYGVSPHTDFGCLSVLAQHDSGLKVETADGQWLDVAPLAGTFVVNIGDLLSRWTNSRFRSVPHCVVNSGENARYSVVVFVDPNSHTVIDPVVSDGDNPRYEPIDCDTYISRRFDRSFAYRQ